ncbi:hypothetical protein QAD02_012929 [Eretmocerus hayati]|uniref:Uncharacterized protein n=1 Tax=Eretmocerus hayati TaxID=131215 RepID=A0ACC2P3Y7_9HYME|nr:hypothetical protein QAD02_012929 [Eretmocerus hayati]
MTTHALVLWGKTQDLSVAEGNDLKEGEAKYGEKYYSAKVIMRSTSKIFLDSLHVTKNSEISPADEQEAQQSRELLERRADHDQAEKTKQEKQVTAKNSRKSLLAISSSIFDEDTSDDEQTKEPQSFPAPVNNIHAPLKKRRIRSKTNQTNSRKDSGEATTPSVLEKDTITPDRSSDKQTVHDAAKNRACICANFPDGKYLSVTVAECDNRHLLLSKISSDFFHPTVTLEHMRRFELILSVASMLQMSELENADTITKVDEKDRRWLPTLEQVRFSSNLILLC